MEQNNNPYTPYSLVAGSIISFLKLCRREGITSIDEAIVAYDEHIAAVAQTMRPATTVAAARQDLRCPLCGAVLEINELRCRIVSPRWRTQLACSSDNCNWHALSEYNRQFLVVHGLHGYVERG